MLALRVGPAYLLEEVFNTVPDSINCAAFKLFEGFSWIELSVYPLIFFFLEFKILILSFHIAI